MNHNDYENLQKEIAAANWRKTNYISPHEYITKRDYPKLFKKICRIIDESGYLEKFNADGRIYKYFNIGEYKYWHFTEILNRAKL